MQMIDQVLRFVWAGAELLIVMVTSFYLIVHLAHPNDTAFAQSCCSRFLIWLGFTFSFLPILLVYLDVSACAEISDDWQRIVDGIVKAREDSLPFDSATYAVAYEKVREVFDVQRMLWIIVIVA